MTVGGGWSREYPERPVAGVAGVVVRGDEVLLILRGRAPMSGSWSLPGGALETGETMVEGVVREVWEETGVRVRPVEMVMALDRIVRDGDGRVRFHYVLTDWMCVPEEDALADATPVCGDDAAGVAWVGRGDLTAAPYAVEGLTLEVIEKAFGRARELGI